MLLKLTTQLLGNLQLLKVLFVLFVLFLLFVVEGSFSCRRVVLSLL
jgi:hypothetical protein